LSFYQFENRKGKNKNGFQIFLLSFYSERQEELLD
jgi:hypothetical protein